MASFKTGLEALLPRGSSPADGLRALALLVRIRFAHAALQLLMLAPALHFGWMFPADVPYALSAIGALLAFNLLSLAFRRRATGAGPAFIVVQNVADITAMTVLFGVSGGLTNPLHSLIHFQIGLAGILLPARAALLVLAVGCASLATLAWSATGLSNLSLWIGPLGPNLAYEWLLACVVAACALFAARLNRIYLERLGEARERVHQQDRLRAVGAAAAGFCHELASPLNASTLIAARLRRKTAEAAPGLDAEWNEFQQNLGRCERIVRGMAEAPWDAGDLLVQRTDAALLLGKITADWTGRVPIRAQIPEGDAVLQAPPVALGHVLLNLLRNAEEASPRGSEIEVALSLRDDFIAIRVADRGQGLDPAVRKSLGRPFNSSKGEGRGLGLFAALHLAESLGGSLEFPSREGGGTEAVLTLPRRALAEAV